MKKKLLIFILFLFLIPKVSYAFNCTTTGITGAAGGRGSPQGNVGSCGGAKTCLLSYPGHGSLAFAGVRIQIYKYTGSGSPQLVGSGVDIWATNSEAAWKYYNGHFTSPLRANLRYKANCSPYSTNIDSVFSVSQSSYFSGNSYNVEQSDSLKQAFNSQTHGGKNDVAEFVLQHNAGTPTSGYVKQYFLDYLINGDIDNLTTSNYSINRFRLSEKEVSDMQTTPDDYYITAEILYRFIYSDKVYYGTVSEGEYFFWPCGKQYGWTYDDGSYADYSLYSLNETVGSILSKNNSGKHIIDIWLGSNNTTKPSCSVAKGWAVWNLHEVCEECGSSCQKDCEQYSKGSFQHQLCAQGYCETNEKDDVAGCVNKCTYVDKDEGCNGECKVSKNSSGSLQCSNSPGTAELEAQSCHDDNTSYTVIDNELDVNYSSSGKYSYSSLKYYKIDCTEKFKLRDLPTRDSNAWLTKTDVGTLHLGFTLDYNKKCEIKYKIGISNDKGSVSYDWQSDFKNSRLQNDIIDTKKAIDNSNKAIAELQEELKTAQTEKKKELIQESIESYKNIIEVAKKTFEELMELAPTSFSYNGKTGGGVIDARLILLTQQDHKGQNYLEPTIELQTPGAEASYNGSYSETVDHLVLEPVACRETPQTTTTTSVEYCAWREDLQKYTTRTTTTTTTNTLFECDKVDANGNSVPIKAKVADNKYSATLSKTLYYELPDSYVLTQSEEDGLVFHSTFKNDVDIDFKSAEAQCNDYLKRQSYTGKCLKKDNLYQFPQFKDKLIVDTITSRNKKFNYTIKINNMGYCGEKLGGYTYSCSYQFKEDTECVKCSQYTKGSAEYNACYEANCSCKAICNGNVACEQKYCPTNCVSCGDSTSYYEDVDCDDPGNPPTCDDPPCPPVSDTCDPTKSDCCNDECSKNYVAGTDSLAMCQYECCSKNANGNIQALTNCCHRYCEKTSGGSNNDKYNECVQTWCDCPECEGGLNFVYRSIDINDPFNGREKEKDGVGLNWRGKIGYITEENNSKNKQYYDSTNSTVKNEITSEYIVDLSSDMIKSVKKNREIGGVEANTTYTTTNESKTTHSKVGASNSEETVDPYCSYLLHDVLETNGVLKQNDTAGMRCK